MLGGLSSESGDLQLAVHQLAQGEVPEHLSLERDLGNPASRRVARAQSRAQRRRLLRRRQQPDLHHQLHTTNLQPATDKTRDSRIKRPRNRVEA